MQKTGAASVGAALAQCADQCLQVDASDVGLTKYIA